VSAGLPQARADPQASTPEGVEKGHEPRQEPDGNEVAALTVLGSPGDEGHGPGAGQDRAQRDDDPWPAEPGRADEERQRKRDHGDEIPGHCSGIGSTPRERDPSVALVQNRGEGVFPDAERLLELPLRDDQGDEDADAVRVDP